jgi:predicted unusual protein kinase regulating ubiquinone biosynthesis (AarF/ABC1/UbiB family)
MPNRTEPASSSLRKRTLTFFFLAATLFLDYFFFHLFGLFQSSAGRSERRRRLHRRSAIRLRNASVKLRGILIKLAQFMSTRVDLLPEEYTQELAMLQDRVPPSPVGEILEKIRLELGKEPLDLFDRFDEAPIASASLGQVHVAWLDGEKVAVKVQYPGIREVVETDLRAVRILSRFLQRYFKTIHFDVLYDEFSRSIHEELDYLKEGRHAERFRANFSKDPRIVVPRVIWSHTTPQVLTLEYVEGIKIDDDPALRSEEVPLKEVAALLVESYIEQILGHRLFHADPHPGNLFVQPPSGSGPLRLVYVDFGMMQDITPQIHEGIQRMMMSIIERDNRGIASALIDLGFIVRTDSFRDVEKVVAFFMERYRDMTPKQFKSVTLAQIMEDLTALFQVFPALQVPNYFMLFARAAGILSGLCSKLNPDLNIIDLARPHAQRFINRETLIDRLLGKGGEIAKSLVDLPQALQRFLAVANSGQFRTEMHSQDLSGILGRIYRLGYRALLSMMALALFAFYAYLSPFLTAPDRFLVGGLMILLTFGLLWSYLREGRIR